MSVPYLDSDLPAAGRYLTVAFGGARRPIRTPAPPTVSLTSTAGPVDAGRVRAEHDDLARGRSRATVVTRRSAAVVR